ncbi:hypothetical protein F5Y16DRAFT_393146 [Xylariaceae sp. FL0255]|nr:hypothetical protein F5Y16DRAFT_393146 [Xylariaceae sp. FL0255]
MGSLNSEFPILSQRNLQQKIEIERQGVELTEKGQLVQQLGISISSQQAKAEELNTSIQQLTEEGKALSVQVISSRANLSDLVVEIRGKQESLEQLSVQLENLRQDSTVQDQFAGLKELDYKLQMKQKTLEELKDKEEHLRGRLDQLSVCMTTATENQGQFGNLATLPKDQHERLTAIRQRDTRIILGASSPSTSGRGMRNPKRANIQTSKRNTTLQLKPGASSQLGMDEWEAEVEFRVYRPGEWSVKQSNRFDSSDPSTAREIAQKLITEGYILSDRNGTKLTADKWFVRGRSEVYLFKEEIDKTLLPNKRLRGAE